MPFEFSEDKLSTQNPFIDLLLYNLKILAYNCVIKEQNKADKYETKDSLYNASLYISCIENHVELPMFDNIKYPRDIMIEAGMTNHQIFIYEEFGKSYRVPENIAPKLTELLRKWYIDTYMHDKELNQYYRNLMGMPAIGEWGLPISEFEFMFPDSFSYDRSLTFMHELPNGSIKELNDLGILDSIFLTYPEHKYLKNKIYDLNIYEIRKKLDFQILWHPNETMVDSNVMEEFLIKYAQNRRFLIETVYSYAMELEEPNYHDMMVIYLVLSVMIDMLVDVQAHIIKKDLLDRRCIEYIFSMYEVPYYREIPINFQKSLCRNIHNLCKYKSSTTEMLNLIKLFDTKNKYNIKIFKYYLLKQRLLNSHDEFEWKSKKVLKGNYNKDLEEQHIIVDITTAPKEYAVPKDIELYDSNIYSNNKNIKYMVEGKKPAASNNLEARMAAASTIASINKIKFDLTLFGQDPSQEDKTSISRDILWGDVDMLDLDPLHTTSGLGSTAVSGAGIYDISAYANLTGNSTNKDIRSRVNVQTADYVNLDMKEIKGSANYFHSIKVYDLNSEVMYGIKGQEVHTINSTVTFEYTGIIPFPFDYYLQKGNLLFIRVNNKVLKENEDYEIYDYNKVRFFNNVLDGQKELTYDFYYDKTTDSTKFNIDKRYIFKTKVKSFEGANSIDLNPIPFNNFFLKGNQLIVTVDSIFLSPNTYEVDQNNILRINDKINTLGKKVNCIFIYSEFTGTRFDKFSTIATEDKQNKFVIKEPFINYCANENKFFVTIGNRFISKNKYEVQIDIESGISYIVFNESYPKDTVIDFNFIYSSNSICTKIELKKKEIVIVADENYQTTFNVEFPFKNYISTRYKVYLKYLDKYLPETWYSVTNSGITLINETLALHKGDSVVVELVYMDKDRTLEENSNIKVAMTHFIASRDKEYIVPIEFPIDNFITKGNKIVVDIDGTLLEDSDFKINKLKSNIRILRSKHYLKKNQKVNITYIYNGDTEYTLQLAEKSYTIFNRNKVDFNIKYPFFPYLQTGQGFLSISESAVHSNSDLSIIDNFNIGFNKTQVSNEDTTENILFIYNKFYELNSQFKLTNRPLLTSIENIGKDGYLDIKVPFDYYFENQWLYFVTDANNNFIDESEYNVFNGSMYFTNPEEAKVKYSGGILVHYIYSENGGSTSSVGYVYEEDYASTTNLKFCKVPINELYVSDKLKNPNNYRDYDIMVKGDGWWDGVDYKQNNHQLVKDEIYKQQWNYARTKYYGITQIMDLSEYSTQMSYFYSMLYDDQFYEEKLLVKIPSLSITHQFKLAHLFIFMSVLTYVFNGIEDFIIDNPAKTMIVQGFNFRTSLADLKEYLRKKHRTEDEFPIWDFITPKSQIKDLAEFMNIFKTNMNVRQTICQNMLNAEDWEEYKVWSDMYSALMNYKLNMEYFKLSNGTIAKTYTEFLQDKDKYLYEFINRVKGITNNDEKIDTIVNMIDDIIYILDEYMGDCKYIFNDFAGHSGIDIMNYIMRMIEFFKSYKIVFLTKNSTLQIECGKSRDEDTTFGVIDASYDNEIDDRQDYFSLSDKVYNIETNTIEDRFDLRPWMREDIVFNYNNFKKYITIDLRGNFAIWSEPIYKDLINGTAIGDAYKTFDKIVLNPDPFVFVKNQLDKSILAGTLAPFINEINTVISGSTKTNIETHPADSFQGEFNYSPSEYKRPLFGGLLNIAGLDYGYSFDGRASIFTKLTNFKDYLKSLGVNLKTPLTNYPRIVLIKDKVACNVSGMFDGWEGVTDFPLIQFDTRYVSDFSKMFRDCKKATSLPIVRFLNTNNATTTESMFENCAKVTYLDFSGLNFNNVTNFSRMFASCSSLSIIDGIIDMKSCTNCTGMFDGCSSLRHITIMNPPADFDLNSGLAKHQYTVVTANTTEFELNARFTINTNFINFKNFVSSSEEYSKLETVNNNLINAVRGKAASGTTYMFAMSKLKTIPNLSFDTSKALKMDGMFAYNNSLESVDLGGINTSEATTLSEMFAMDTKLTSISLPSNFNTSKCEDFSMMFAGCTSLKKIDGIIDMKSCLTCTDMFVGCTGLTQAVKIKNPPLDFDDKSGLPKDKYVIVQ